MEITEWQKILYRCFYSDKNVSLCITLKNGRIFTAIKVEYIKEDMVWLMLQDSTYEKFEFDEIENAE